MPTHCPACHALLRLDDLALSTGPNRTECPECQSTLVVQVEVTFANETGSMAAATIPVLPPEARLAALGETPPTSPQTRPARIGGLTLLVSCLLLLALLGLQLAYFERDRWARDPHLRPALAVLCDHLDCTLPLSRDPTYLEIVTRSVRRHPDHPNALLVELTFRNLAPFAVSMPRLRLRFTDVRHLPVAEREFRPEEYLPAGFERDAPLGANEVIRSRLEIVDPGENAMGYEFSFHYR